MNHQAPEKPITYAERVIIAHILEGDFPIGERLPAERELAKDLGVTRPTLREAIRHLEQEGWVLVQAGKPTVVRDFWHEGGLNVLGRILAHQSHVKASFITQLLEFRLLLAPEYTRDAVRNTPDMMLALLASKPEPDADISDYASFDWSLQHRLTVASGNVIYPLIINGFTGFYESMARIYFRPVEARQASYQYYVELENAFQQEDADQAYTITQNVMQLSIQYWQTASQSLERIPLEEGSI